MRCITDWLNRLSQRETIPSDIKALYFGLFEGENSYVIYFIGNKNYDDDDDDWACDIDYKPGENYIQLDIPLSEDWQTVLDCVQRTLKEILNNSSSPVYTYLHGKVVCIGFDDGKLIRIQ